MTRWRHPHHHFRVHGNEIDPRRAIELKATGLTWSDVGDALAEENGRSIRYTGNAVASRVNTYKRELEE